MHRTCRMWSEEMGSFLFHGNCLKKNSDAGTEVSSVFEIGCEDGNFMFPDPRGQSGKLIIFCDPTSRLCLRRGQGWGSDGGEPDAAAIATAARTQLLCAHVCAYAHVCAGACPRAHVRVPTCTRTRAGVCLRAHTSTLMCVCAHIYVLMCICACTRTRPDLSLCARTCMCSRVSVCAPTYVLMCVCSSTYRLWSSMFSRVSADLCL